MREIRTKTVCTDGSKERTTESTASRRAESIIESETFMVHTIMWPDGSGATCAYRRAVDGQEWVLDTRASFGSKTPTPATRPLGVHA